MKSKGLKKNIPTRLAACIASLCMLCCMLVWGADDVRACTAVYVGSEVSADGTVILARSNDFPGVCGNHITVTPRVENKPGRTMPVDMGRTVFTELPQTTYRYVCTPFFSGAMEARDLPNDATVATNEYGVNMTMSVTAFSNEAAMKADPWVEDGLTENTAVDLVVCQSKTAREAVEVLLGLIDEYGSSETNIALIADQQEVWYVEMYNGHQYAAVKLPSDKVCAFGNEFSMEYLSDYEDCIVSEDLYSMAEENGFAVYGKNDELNLFDTYAGKELTLPYCHMRTWIGHQILAPSVYGDDYDKDELYPLCFDPDQKVSLEDVCSLIRNRFEGTKYDPDKTGRIDIRVIGTDTAQSVHVIQVDPDLPAGMSSVIWESSAPAVYGVFVPVSNAATSVSEAYGRDQPPEENAVFDAEHYPYYVMKELNTLCVEPDDYKTYGRPVRNYWHKAEKGMFAGMSQVLNRASKLSDEGKAADYITAYCNAMQTQAFEDAKKLLNDVTWTQSDNSNTMKLGRNPENGEILNKPRVLEPMKVSLDPSVYTQVPETAAEADAAAKNTTGYKPVVMCLIGLVILAILLEGWALVRARRREKKSE